MATSDFQEVNVDDVDLVSSPKTSAGEKKAKLKIALIGESGSGKTSFINAIRGLEDDDEHATATGVGEETIEAKLYPHLLDADVTLCDHPGHNITYSDAESYFKTFYLSRFDAFLLFIKGNGTKTDQGLIKELDSRKKPFFLIRTNVDSDLPRRRNRNKENEILEKIRENCLKLLAQRENGDGEKKLFLISNRDPEKWEFGRLKKAILYELQESGIKPTLGSETTQNCTDEEIKLIDKKSVFRELVKKVEDIAFEVKDKGVEAARRKMEQALEKWKNEEIKVAFVGNSGVGKSSLINALRNVKDDGSGNSNSLWAETGVVETTVDITEYPFPKNKKIKLCDLPGIGSKNYGDLKSYCKKIDLKQFDAFVIVTASRFPASDVALTDKLRSINRPFLFVRTKIDVDYDNEKEKYGKLFKEEDMLEKIKGGCFNNLKSYDEVFLISNKHPSKWDFPRLVLAIINKLSLDKQVCFVFSLYIASETILKEKATKLRGRIYRITFLSVINKVRSDEKSRSYDDKVIRENVKFFKSQLGLPDKDAKEFEEMSAKLQDEVQEFDKIDEMDVDDWMRMFAAQDASSPVDNAEIENLEKKLANFCELKGSAKPFWFVYYSLSLVLHKMSVVATKVLKEKMDQQLSFKYD